MNPVLRVRALGTLSTWVFTCLSRYMWLRVLVKCAPARGQLLPRAGGSRPPPSKVGVGRTAEGALSVVLTAAGTC